MLAGATSWHTVAVAPCTAEGLKYKSGRESEPTSDWVEVEASIDGRVQLEVSKVREVGEASEAQWIKSGVITWPARTRENEEDGALEMSVIMSQPLATLVLTETGADALPVHVLHREPLM